MEQTQNQTTPAENPEEKTLLEKAEAAAERIEKATAAMAEMLERQEKIRADELLGGRSSAGQPAPEPKEETAKEYAERVMRGGK